MNKAIFLDRDGTINEDVGDLYKPTDLVFIPYAIEALRLLQEEFILFIITNQSGVGRGVFKEKECINFNNYFVKTLAKHGVCIKEVFCCPHIKEDMCHCRKPSPYFINKAKKAYRLKLAESYCIGDHPHDIDMAQKAGTRSIFLLTGHGTKHRHEVTFQPDYVANNLYEAALWIRKRN